MTGLFIKKNISVWKKNHANTIYYARASTYATLFMLRLLISLSRRNVNLKYSKSSSLRVLISIRHGSGQKILIDFEFYISQIAGLDEIMVLLL
jgi:hypothetical protein